MHRSTPSLLSRLRLHRGLWFVCLVTMLFKLTAASVCLADGVQVPPLASTSVVVAATSAAPDGDCVLGEVGGCHCVCSHSVPLPPIVEAITHLDVPGSDWPVVAPSYTPTHVGALLRPPIA